MSAILTTMYRRPAFTLIELLVVIAIIGSLSMIVITAINPSRQLAQARNAQRQAHIHAIANAVEQYSIGSGGHLPSGIDTSLRMVGTAASGCSVNCGTGGQVSTGVLLTLYASADTSLWQANATTNYGTNAQLWEYPWTPSWTRRGLVQFDLSVIPTGAMISSASLDLREATTYGSTRTIALHRVTRSWVESEATWNRAVTGTNWTTVGGDFSSTATATASLSWDGILGWNSWNVATDVQAFVNGTQQNYGWLIKDNSEDSSQAYWFFHSKDEADHNEYRPRLIVTYTPAGGTTAAACLNLTPPLTDTYLPTIPEDPSLGSPAKTYYSIMEDSRSRLTVRACSAELGETIEVSR